MRSALMDGAACLWRSAMQPQADTHSLPFCSRLQRARTVHGLVIQIEALQARDSPERDFLDLISLQCAQQAAFLLA